MDAWRSPTVAFSSLLPVRPRPGNRSDPFCRRPIATVVTSAKAKKKTGGDGRTSKGFGRAPSKQPNSDANATDEPAAENVDDAAIGEQTKKTELAGQKKLENPLDKLFAKTKEQDEARRELNKIKPITLSDDELRDTRWLLSISDDDVLEKLVAAYDEGTLLEVASANRHFLGETFLYRMSSMILKYEGDGETERAQKLRTIRTTLLRLGWEFDRSLKNTMKEKERKIADAIRGNDVVRDIKRGMGASQNEKDVYWLVLFSAVAAWEAANESSQSPVRNDVVDRLTAATATVRAKITDCSQHVQALDRILTAETVEDQQAGIDSVDDAIIVAWTEYIICLERCPPASYKAMLTKIVSIRDFALSKKHGTRRFGLDPVRVDFENPVNDSVLLQTYPGDVDGDGGSLIAILK